MRNRIKNWTPHSGVWNCKSRVKWAGLSGDKVGVYADRVSLLGSYVVGASAGERTPSSDENPSIRHNTIISSWHALERMRSPKKATLIKSDQPMIRHGARIQLTSLPDRCELLRSKSGDSEE